MLANIIAIEGPDKHGKATQSKMLAHSLRRYGDRVALVEVPFNDRVTHRLIYWMLTNGFAKRYPNVFQFVQFLNKLLFQWTYLLWLRLSYDFVILDRWRLSAVVYGDATGVNKTFNRVLYHLLKPAHLTVVLHGISFKRKEADDVYEKDSSLQEAVKAGYREWALDHLNDHLLVLNTNGRDWIHDTIYTSVCMKFSERA